MRILHVSASYCRQDGGPSEVLRGLLPALSTAGHTVSLITTDKGLTDLERSHPPTSATQIAKFRGPYSLTYAPQLPRLIRSALAATDIVHVHGVDNYPSVVAMRESTTAGIPFVLQPHGAWDQYHRAEGHAKKWLWGRLLQDRLAKHAAAAVVSSAREATGVGETLSGARVFVVSLGVDSSLAALDTPWSERSGILFLGRIAKKKRLDLVLEAFAILAPEWPKLRLTIAGPLDGDLAYTPSELADSLGVAGQVDFLGPVGPGRRRALLSTRRVLVLPSDDESYGVAAAEALVAGLDVVASSQVGIVEDLAREGLLQTVPQDAVQIAKALQQSLRSAPRVGHAKLHALARQRLTWAASARSLLDVYESAVK